MGFLREPSHLLIIALVIILLFGSRKLPDAARGLGRSMRIFKSEVRQMKDDDKAATDTGDGERTAAEPEPLEGRVIRNDSTRSEQRAGEYRRDA